MKNIILRIVRCVINAVLAVCLITLFATLFYDASEHVIIVNILFWLFTLSLAYFIAYFLFLLVNFIFKAEKPKLMDGFAFASGPIGIILFTLFIIKDTNDSLFLNAFILIGSIAATFQLFIEIWKKYKKSPSKKIGDG